ncbi:MAG TPA: DNA alkylation repair protein [Croceibacterium sp.]|nr:DNA alkylation repair protein [Croceibacterium sp.]
MTLDEVMNRLRALGDEKVKALAIRAGAEDDQFGVKLGDIRKLANEIRADHPLALRLWATGNVDARLLAVLLLKPRQLSAEELDAMVRGNRVMQVSDWLNSYVVKKHPDKEALRPAWMHDDDPVAARAGWSLTADRVAKQPDGLDLPALLDRIEAEMGDAAPETQWTMNTTLAQIGIHHPQNRGRALAIGEALGVYRDYPTSAGCTSPFAPEWIGEMVRRQEGGA